MASPAETAAMRRALELAAAPEVPGGPNPRVGCVVLDPSGQEIGAGFHLGAGTPHAEVVAMAAARAALGGATVVVTLEPCVHHGRTPPCVDALLAAGVARVVYAQDDPNPMAAGGGARLRSAGVDVESGVLAEEAFKLNPAWSIAVARRRPFVTWKVAATLDGRTAATDGSSQWITSEPARRDVHRRRALADVVLVGTGTALADDPHLAVRDENGVAIPTSRQPLRAVMGLRDLRPGSRVLDSAAETVLLRTRDPFVALAELGGYGRTHVWLEGGATLAAAFLRAGLVDEVLAYVAPALLGGGRPVVGDLGINGVDAALRLTLVSLARVGEDALLTMRTTPEGG